MSELAFQIESIKSLKPKKKVKLIQKFMTFMTALKLLFNEYQEIESSIKRHDDLTLCQPILKGSMRKLFLKIIFLLRAEWALNFLGMFWNQKLCWVGKVASKSP